MCRREFVDVLEEVGDDGVVAEDDFGDGVGKGRVRGAGAGWVLVGVRAWVASAVPRW